MEAMKDDNLVYVIQSKRGIYYIGVIDSLNWFDSLDPFVFMNKFSQMWSETNNST